MTQPVRTGAGILPTFLVIGAMKAGTTSLYEYLKSHPQVFMPDTKELDFFVEELNFTRGAGWYRTQFAQAGGATAVGEASTSYTKFPLYRDVPARIGAMLPEVRLVYVIRHPIERIRSQYLHERLLGEERLPFERAVLVHERYVSFSRYANQLSHYLEHFPRERILLVEAEALRTDRASTLRRICGFLGIDAGMDAAVVEGEYHRTDEKQAPRSGIRGLVASAAYKRMSPYVPSPVKAFGRRYMSVGVDPDGAVVTDDLRCRLEDLLKEDIVLLRGHLGEDFHGWGIA